MPVFQLPEDYHIFPHPELAEEDGLLAVGGDLNPERLLTAYSFGIFPWYSEPNPYLWWHPNPRCVLFPSKLKVHKSMRSYFNQEKFRITYDYDFSYVIKHCGNSKRKNQRGSWITEEMKHAYIRLHELGYAHSVEVWKGKEIVGGLYGIALGKIFFGESMFSHVSNASKFGFISFVRNLEKFEFELIDCQQKTKHLISLGAEVISRIKFCEFLLQNRLYLLKFDKKSTF